MPFWSKETFVARKGDQIITPFLEGQVDCAAYTLRMGGEYFVTPDSAALDLSTHTKRRLEPGESFQIPPGQFAFLLTEEYLHLPRSLIAFVSLKTGIKWRGLVNVSGFHIDGGFEGYFIFAVYNAGPNAIHMQRGQDLFLMWVAELDNANTKSYRRDKLPQKEISPQLVTAVSAPIMSLQSVSSKLVSMDAEVRSLKNKVERMAIYGGIVGVGIGLSPFVVHTLIWHWSDVKDFFLKIGS